MPPNCKRFSGILPNRTEKGIAISPQPVYNDEISSDPRDLRISVRRNEIMKNLLQLLEDDSTLTHAQLAAMTGMTEAEVSAAVAQYEKDRIILGYKTIVDWDRTQQESVTALIEVSVTPQRGEGFDRVAQRIYQYDEVESLYLMSGGAYDMTVTISGRTLKEVAQFVGEKLAPIEGVTGTATHFILKKYKEKHLVFPVQEVQEERFVFE